MFEGDRKKNQDEKLRDSVERDTDVVLFNDVGVETHAKREPEYHDHDSIELRGPRDWRLTGKGKRGSAIVGGILLLVVFVVVLLIAAGFVDIPAQ